MSDGYTLWTGGGWAFQWGKIVSINFGFIASKNLSTTETVVPGHIKAPYIPNNNAFIGNIDKRGIIEYDGEIRLQLDSDVPSGQRTWVRGLYLIG